MGDTRAAFNRGVLTGLLAVIGASAVNWLISGSHAGAPQTRRLAVIAQAVVGLGAAAWMWWRQRRVEAGAGVTARRSG